MHMNTAHAKYIKSLLQTENEHLKKLNNIVCEAVEQENILLQRIGI